MPTEVIRIDSTKDYRNSILRAAQVLRDGGLVGFPTETVYGVGVRADRREAVDALRKAKQREADKPFTVHIGRREDVHRYVPRMSAVARRLVSKGWPGPLTIVFDIEDPASAAVMQDLGVGNEDLIYHDATVGIRCPADQTAADVLSEAGVPVVAASANLAGRPAPRSADGVLAELDGVVDLLLDGGPAQYAKASTVVRVSDSRYEVLREGVIEARTLNRYASLNILFVCSGNTCRSPMAAALARQVLASRLGCREDELADRGVHISSAGAAGMGGSPASEGAVAAMARMKSDLSRHVSRPLDVEAIHQADHILCMTRSHVEAVASLVPSAREKTALLGGDDEIMDPFGGSMDAYVQCAEKIAAALQARLAEIEL